MKKYISILFVSLLLLTSFLSACTQTTSAPATQTPTQKAVATATVKTNTSTPSSTYKSSINSKNLKFDAGVQGFFDGNVEKALVQMEPLLNAAGFAEYSYKKLFISSGSDLDPTFSWYIVYWLLNSNSYKNSGITVKSDGTMVLSPKTMKEVFSTAFCNFNGTLPTIPKDFDGGIISIDKSGNYIVNRANSEEVYFELQDITISKANSATDPTQSATLKLNAVNLDKKVLGTVYIEVCHNDKSYYKYSIQSADITN